MTVNVSIVTTADPAHFEQWDSGVLQGQYPVPPNTTQPAYATLLREIRVLCAQVPPSDPKVPPPPPPPPTATAAVNVHCGNRPARVQTYLSGVLQGTVTVPRYGTQGFTATPTQEIRVLELLS